jgi:hypothetical protein
MFDLSSITNRIVCMLCFSITSTICGTSKFKCVINLGSLINQESSEWHPEDPICTPCRPHMQALTSLYTFHNLLTLGPRNSYRPSKTCLLTSRIIPKNPVCNPYRPHMNPIRTYTHAHARAGVRGTLQTIRCRGKNILTKNNITI